MHDIPKDVQAIIGKGVRFAQSLQTEDRNQAKRRAVVFEVKWRAEIEQARKGVTDPLEKDALFFRQVLQDAGESEREVLLHLVADQAQAIVDRAADRAGIIDQRDPAYDDLPEQEEAERFYAIATGKTVRFGENVENWLATVQNEEKSKDMKRSTVAKFEERFPYVQDVKQTAVQQWVYDLATVEKKTEATIRRHLSELRGYWRYLVSVDGTGATKNVQPFVELEIPKINNGDGWTAFAPTEVVKLLKAAETKKDELLADFIRLGMWTGARREAICALRTEDIDLENWSLTIRKDKTRAGRRTIPIHSRLKDTVKRLMDASKDGYLLPIKSKNKYERRSDPVGKQFGHLKTGLGFGPDKVFHSLRHTVVTLFENAGVPENIAARIVGHDLYNITFKIYSDGVTLEVMREALEKIDYPAP